MEFRRLHFDVQWEPYFELIERKGWGHPDTLSDGLAEALSRAYSCYTRDRYGVILHHNFDKVGLLGGKSSVSFGRGVMTSPVRVLLNGRASWQCGDDQIPVADILTTAAKEFLSARLPRLDVECDLVFHNNLSTGSSPGYVDSGSDPLGSRKTWFAPRSAADLREAHRTTSNDTSVGCAFWPLSTLETTVLELERSLTAPKSTAERPWLGTDVKVMARRADRQIRVTMCVPQIADEVPGPDAYRANLEWVHAKAMKLLTERLGTSDVELWINTKDDFSIPELYLTAIGSSIESGDEGLVGRGNRPNGLISMARPYSMEGLAGKNPVYHVGKLYSLVAENAAKVIWSRFGVPVEVWLISQEGRLLSDAWQSIVRCAEDIPEDETQQLIQECLDKIPAITGQLLAGELELF